MIWCCVSILEYTRMCCDTAGVAWYYVGIWTQRVKIWCHWYTGVSTTWACRGGGVPWRGGQGVPMEGVCCVGWYIHVLSTRAVPTWTHWLSKSCKFQCRGPIAIITGILGHAQDNSPAWLRYHWSRIFGVKNSTCSSLWLTIILRYNNYHLRVDCPNIRITNILVSTDSWRLAQSHWSPKKVAIRLVGVASSTQWRKSAFLS